MGSLAPHDAPPNAAAQEQQLWVSDPRNGCKVLGSDFDPGDSVSWSGACAVGLAWGPGTLIFLNHGRTIETISGTFAYGALSPGHVSAKWSDGSRYDGDQSGGQFDGTGAFTSATGDRFQGEWKLGALNGRATVQWANGDRYEGEWKGGKSDGQGTEVWADGHRYEGLWSAGKPVADETPAASAQPAVELAQPAVASAQPRLPASALPASPASASAPVATSATRPEKPTIVGSAPARRKQIDGSLEVADSPLGAIVGSRLYAVDGSTVEFDVSEDGLSRLVTLPSGTTQEISFAFMNARIGTVSSNSTAVGLFRTGTGELDVDYEDGTTEIMKPETGGGLFVTARTQDGRLSCTEWYPQGHVFADAEKRAAVQEYAARLGVAVPASSKKGAGPKSCGGAFLEKLPGGATAASEATDSVANGKPVAAIHSEQDEQLPAAGKAALQDVAVKAAVVQAIDTPATTAAPQSALQAASFAVAAPVDPAAAPEAVATSVQNKQNASQCLSVMSNGTYWGFQNSCEKNIQFVYCELSDSNPLTSCHQTTVSGSVTANGFSALVSDGSLAEKGVKHQFRWMACDGGAGEVVPHLDSVDPPVGRCQRTVASVER